MRRKLGWIGDKAEDQAQICAAMTRRRRREGVFQTPRRMRAAGAENQKRNVRRSCGSSCAAGNCSPRRDSIRSCPITFRTDATVFAATLGRALMTRETVEVETRQAGRFRGWTSGELRWGNSRMAGIMASFMGNRNNYF